MERSLTEKTANTLADWLIKQSKGDIYSHTYAMAWDDGSIVERVSRPCYGELRPYGQGSGDTVRKPSDLTQPFPDTGRPLGLGLLIQAPTPDKDKFLDFAVSGLSPWRKATEGAELVKSPISGRTIGVVFVNSKVNADILASFCLNSRYQPARWTELVQKDVSPQTAMVLAVRLMNFPSMYYVNVDIPAVYHGNPHVPEKHLWYDRAAYRRPMIERIFQKVEKDTEDELRGVSQANALEYVSKIEGLVK